MPTENGAVSSGDGTPYGSGVSVLLSVRVREQVPPIWSRSMVELNRPADSAPLTGSASEPQVM